MSPAATEVESLSQYPAQSVYCGSMVMFGCSSSNAAMSSSVIAWRVSLPHQVNESVTGSSESSSLGASSAGAAALPAQAVSASIVAAPMAATTPMRRRVLPRMVMSFRGVVWCRGVGGAGGAVGGRATVRARVGSVAPIT